MKISLSHTLRFSLGTPARAVQHLLLTALPTPQQKIERWSVTMPGFAEAAVFRDAFGNRAHLVSQVKPDEEMLVTVSGEVTTIDRAGVLGRLDYDPVPALFRRPTPQAKSDPALLEGLSDAGGRIAMLHELMDRVNRTLSLPVTEAASPVIQGQSQSQSQGGQSQSQGGQSQSQGGQSQSQGSAPAAAAPAASKENPADFAHAFIGAARALGISARYVTGYLVGDDGGGSFHAWAEGFDDRLGWIGFDPMFNLCPADTYVRLASGLDATSTMPIRSVPVWDAMPVETVELTVVP